MTAFYGKDCSHAQNGLSFNYLSFQQVLYSSGDISQVTRCMTKQERLRQEKQNIVYISIANLDKKQTSLPVTPHWMFQTNVLF